MKVNSINSQGDKVWFNFGCSWCGKEVDVSDAFCKHCGKKLSHLPKSIGMREAAGILSRGLKDNMTQDKKIGNISQIRTALEEVQDILINTPCEPHTRERQDVIDKIDAALKLPHRNGDKIGLSKDELHNEWWEWSGDLKNCNPDGTVKMTFGEWLLALEEKKNG